MVKTADSNENVQPNWNFKVMQIFCVYEEKKKIDQFNLSSYP